MKTLFTASFDRSLLVAFAAVLIPASSFAQVAVSITVAPPAIPVYAQPDCPGDGYMWTPGYWAWGPAGYYWVDGVWVMAPRVGVLWTPGYWDFAGGAYLWHEGYWGPHVGFYGGVNYGFGYAGVGFVGGVWAGNVFRYNTAIVNVNAAVVHNVYVDRAVIRNTTIVNRASFNGPGGLNARPTAGEMAALHEQHFQPTAMQLSHRTEVGQRQANQQQRIAQGLHNGTMTAGQAAHVETKEAQINHQVAADREANGGKLTPAEHQQVNKEQNGTSKQIFRDKHGK